MTKFERWPPEEATTIKPYIVGDSTNSGGDTATERFNIDYVITIGGDGTILTLLRHLQEYEKTRILPPIITFSQGSLNYLANFDTREYQKVLDATVVKNASFDKICIDLRIRLSVTFK